MLLFLPWPGFHRPGIKERTWEWLLCCPWIRSQHFASHLQNFGLCWSRGLSPQRGLCRGQMGHSRGPLEWRLGLPPGHLGSTFQWTNRLRGHCTVWGDWSWLSRENRAATTQWRSGGICLECRGSLGCLRTPIRCDKIQWKTTEPNSTTSAYGSGPSGRKVQVTPPGKKLGPAKVLAEGTWNMEWSVDKPAHNLA